MHPKLGLLTYQGYSSEAGYSVTCNLGSVDGIYPEVQLHIQQVPGSALGTVLASGDWPKLVACSDDMVFSVEAVEIQRQAVGQRCYFPPQAVELRSYFELQAAGPGCDYQNPVVEPEELVLFDLGPSHHHCCYYRLLGLPSDTLLDSRLQGCSERRSSVADHHHEVGAVLVEPPLGFESTRIHLGILELLVVEEPYSPLAADLGSS